MIKYKDSEGIKTLFNKLNVEYITDYIIEIEELLLIDCTSSPYYLDNKNEFEELTERYGSKIKDRFLEDLYIQKTDNRGYGLFTNKSLKESDFIGVYIGVIREEEEFVPFDETGYDSDYAWDFPDDSLNLPSMEINAKYSGNELRFANHGDSPNLRVEHTVVDNMWYIFFVADRNITKGEELTISYGEAYWDTDFRTLA